MRDFIQFDRSKTVIGGVNIAEGKKHSKRLIFNESYTITGKNIIAPSVLASYDLTVIGDMDVKEIEVKGNLYVMGDIKASNISCSNAIVCIGTINADTIIASEIVANDISCHSIECPGNIIVRTTIDIDGSLESNSSVMTGEGIIGRGTFSAKNAVAAEYCDFSGEVFGKVLELETDATFGKPNKNLVKEDTIDGLSTRLKEKISKELKVAGDIDEEHLTEVINHLTEIDKDILSDWRVLMENLIDISYKDKITNLRDYLIIIMAAKHLPVEILKYETIEHVFDKLLVDALGKVDTLPFHAKNIDDLVYALKIVVLCDDVLMIEKDIALDRIFQSVGIKYQTVKKYIG